MDPLISDRPTDFGSLGPAGTKSSTTRQVGGRIIALVHLYGVSRGKTDRIASYRHNAAIYGQNKHAHANLRQILGVERVARA